MSNAMKGVKIVVEERRDPRERSAKQNRSVYKVIQVKNTTSISVRNNYLKPEELETLIRKGADVTIKPASSNL